MARLNEDSSIRTLSLGLKFAPEFAEAAVGSGGVGQPVPQVLLTIDTKKEREVRTQEEVAGGPQVLQAAQLMRVHGCRLQNCRKNIGKAKYSLNVVCRQVLPPCYKPPQL